jgi:hypothetical protein
MVEFAIALPILLMLLFAIIDFSLLFSAWLLIQNMARQAVRYAVTGQYDPANCPVGGCLTQAQEDAARLQTIYDEANHYQAGLFVEDGAAQDESGFLKITVCTGAPYVSILPRMGSDQYGDCLPNEFPGEPGHVVVVMVDFNHPYLTPFLNEVWPWTHLASFHEGIIEQFRVSRLVNLPPDILVPTNTPLPATATFTPSLTYTVTETPSVTPTYEPLFVEIILPAADGDLIVTIDETPFEAIAWDPEVGTNNGDGIDHLTFSFSGPGIIPGSIEGFPAYCAFSGNGPCELMDPVLFASLPNSNLFNTTNDYYMTVTATSPDGRETTVVRRFKIMKPNTPTSTFTNTRTFTPTVPTSTRTFTRTFTNTVPTPTRTYTSTNTVPTPTRTFTNTVPTRTFTNTVPTRTRTATRTFTNTVPTRTFTATRTFTNTVPTRTFTNTVPTSTRTATRTFTNTVPTSTFTVTNTRTNTVPTPTSTRTYTRTNTVPTPTFTFTFTRTNTVPTPTHTFTATVPTRTFTRTFTNTVPTPTFTFTFTFTNTRTNTATYTNTATRTFTLTPTTGITNTFTPSRTPTPSKTICTDC